MNCASLGVELVMSWLAGHERIKATVKGLNGWNVKRKKGREIESQADKKGGGENQKPETVWSLPQAQSVQRAGFSCQANRKLWKRKPGWFLQRAGIGGGWLAVEHGLAPFGSPSLCDLFNKQVLESVPIP